MTHFTRAYRAESSDAPEDGKLLFTASSSDVARDGFSISHEAWDLKDFKKNNIFLWAHRYDEPPIGKVNAFIDKESKSLRAEVQFDLDDPFSASIFRKYVNGYLSAVSVGFDIREIDGEKVDPNAFFVFPKPGSTVTKAELLELSGVPVPADPKALAERAKRGLTHDLSDLLARLTDPAEPSAHPDPTEPSEFVWPGVALHMARLYLDTNDDDETREAAYRRYQRQYRALGHEPPEWMTRSQLSLLDEPCIRSLFGAGEAELLGWPPDGERAGAVLSSRNRGDLEQAITLTQGVLDRAKKESEADADEGKEDAERAFLDRFFPSEPRIQTDDLLRRLVG